MADYGKASNELFTQFVARIAQEIPTATLAMFSKLKYVNAPNFEKFRQAWNAEYLNGFIVHSKAFEGLKGNFPIGFLIWVTKQKANKKEVISEISTEVFNKKTEAIGEKVFHNLPNKTFLSLWLNRPKTNTKPVIALKNAISPATNKPVVTNWAENAISYMLCDSNDMQHAGQTAIFSSVYRVGHDGGFYITPENLWQASVIFSVRRLISATWINDRDQFLQPTEPLTDEFKTDCLIWMLFNGSNLTASANELEWNNQTWSIVNHFIPFTEVEVNAPDRFESDFMVQYLTSLHPLVSRNDGKASDADTGYGGLSAEANAVLNAGRTLWQAYFAHTDVRNVRDELKLNRPDVGWYQIRNALKARNASGDYAPVDFSAFENAYKTLGDKLRPQVYTLGFLRA